MKALVACTGGRDAAALSTICLKLRGYAALHRRARRRFGGGVPRIKRPSWRALIVSALESQNVDDEELAFIVLRAGSKSRARQICEVQRRQFGFLLYACGRERLASLSSIVPSDDVDQEDEQPVSADRGGGRYGGRWCSRIMLFIVIVQHRNRLTVGGYRLRGSCRLPAEH